MISYKQFSEQVIPVPVPVEQQKIADCLTSLDELIVAQGRKMEALKAHKRGLMQQLFPREGETLPRLRFSEFRDAWKETAIGSLCESVSSGRDKADPDGTFNLYGSTGIIGKTESGTYSGKYLLVARVGANAGLLTKVIGRFGVTDNTIVIIMKDDNSIDFVFFSLQDLGLNKMVFGSGQPLITSGQLKSLFILLPGAQEQQKIADCLSSLDTQITTESQKLDALKNHKKALMQQLFPAPDEVAE
ncbi:MAG: restriction endonuclease subunit S [Pseudomonadota bacterium]